MENKRFYPRKALDVLVNYSDYYYAKSKDLSIGGIGIITNKELQAGRFLSFEFSLPDKEHVRVFGKIEWCREDSPDLYENGIEFRLMKDTAKTKIANFIEKLNSETVE
jgi:Tfp pilus assembly protein PilZ